MTRSPPAAVAMELGGGGDQCPVPRRRHLGIQVTESSAQLESGAGFGDRAGGGPYPDPAIPDLAGKIAGVFLNGPGSGEILGILPRLSDPSPNLAGIHEISGNRGIPIWPGSGK